MNRPTIPTPPIPPLPKPARCKQGVKVKGKGKKVARTELSALIGVALTTLKKWDRLGLPSKKTNNKVLYDVGEVMKWRIEWETESLKDELVKTSFDKGDAMTPMQAKLRREIAQALSAELDLVIKREQVANIEDLMSAFSEALIEVRAKLVSMSSRLSGLLSHQEEGDVAKILDSEVSDMLEVLSDYE